MKKPLTKLEAFVWINRKRLYSEVATELNMAESQIWAAYHRAKKKIGNTGVGSSFVEIESPKK